MIAADTSNPRENPAASAWPGLLTWANPAIARHQGAVSREHLDYYLDEFTFPSVPISMRQNPRP